jgi:small GTP-binding protein
VQSFSLIVAAEIEAEMARTQKNKATEYHLGLLKGKLARLRAQLLEPGPGAGGGGGAGFDVSKSGDARIALVGFPSVGKSTFLSKITKTKSEVAAYSFTTLTAIPGVLEYGGAEIQILDLPGIIEGASEGKGRGRQVISAAKTSDLILMVLDATKRAEQRALLEAELEAVGIRLNRTPPNIYLKMKKAGGVKVTFPVTPKHLDEKMIYNILKDYKMLNAEVLIRDENGMFDEIIKAEVEQIMLISLATVDDFIDVIMKDHRKYIKWYVHPFQPPLASQSLTHPTQPLCLQQNRLHLPQSPQHPRPRTTHSSHVLRARSRHSRRRGALLVGATTIANLHKAARGGP